jgi:hypothetical protein
VAARERPARPTPACSPRTGARRLVEPCAGKLDVDAVQAVLCFAPPL